MSQCRLLCRWGRAENTTAEHRIAQTWDIDLQYWKLWRRYILTQQKEQVLVLFSHLLTWICAAASTTICYSSCALSHIGILRVVYLKASAIDMVVVTCYSCRDAVQWSGAIISYWKICATTINRWRHIQRTLPSATRGNLLLWDSWNMLLISLTKSTTSKIHDSPLRHAVVALVDLCWSLIKHVLCPSSIPTYTLWYVHKPIL